MSLAPPAAAPPSPSSASSGHDATDNRRSSTPALYRLMAAVVVVGLALAGLTGFIAASTITTNTDRAEQNTGPVLVATQDVFASVAEADAASAAVFLSGADEDREQRRLYELAIERSTRQLEQVSRLVGDNDDAHESIQVISARLTTYAGLVERARLANVSGLAGAEATLQEAIAIVQADIVPEVQSITDAAQLRLESDADGGRASLIASVVVGIAAIAALIWFQVIVTRRSRRLLNLPLIAATILATVAVVWLISAWVRQQNDLEVAQQDGYESIALTADIQTTAFRYKTLERLAVLVGSDNAADAERTELAERLAAVEVDESLVDAARNGEANGSGLLIAANRIADSTREQAATAEMLARWKRSNARLN